MIRRPPRSTLFPYNDALPISPHEQLEPGLVGDVQLRAVRRNGHPLGLAADGDGAEHDVCRDAVLDYRPRRAGAGVQQRTVARSEEHTSELQSQSNLVCRLLLE